MIIKTPYGEAPEHIRRAWLGIVLPCVEKHLTNSVTGVLTGRPYYLNQVVYYVRQAAACDVLAKNQPVAAQWWKDNGFPKPGRMFTFREEEVLVLQEGGNPYAWG